MAFIAAYAINAAPAAARDYPYCIKGCDYGSALGDCSFATYQQCQASACGRLACCAVNPYFSQNAGLPSNKVSRRRYGIIIEATRGQDREARFPVRSASAIPGLLAISAISAVATIPAQAGYDYPVCLRVYGPVSYNECAYTSMAQCKASASGRPADCSPNAFAAGTAIEPGQKYRRRSAY